MKLPQLFVTKATAPTPDVTPFVLRRCRYRAMLSLGIAVTALSLTSCDNLGQPKPSNVLDKNQIAKHLPTRGQDKAAWASDIYDVFNTLNLERTRGNVCSVVAIIDQESNFKADPPVSNLGATSLKALNEKLDGKLGSTLAGYFRRMLKNEPTVANSFEKQILKVKTEQQLDRVYHEMFNYFSDKYYTSGITNVTKLLGGDVAEKLDPITTLGSMQVHIDYARDHQRVSGNAEELRRDLYTQYGGLYYGIHRLLRYPTNYPDPIYRFADYNSGMYSSRNAAFQKMLAALSGQTIDLDGDLMIYNGSGQSQSEKVLTLLAQKGTIALTPRQISNDLKKEKTAAFATTETYRTIAHLYQLKTDKTPPVAIMPQVVISGAKLSRDYNTNWYATNVNKRYLTCLNKAKP